MTCGGTFDQINSLVQVGLIEIMSDCLKKYKDADTTKVCLETIENILDVAADYFKCEENRQNPFLTRVIESGTLPLIENLQTHPDNDIYCLSLRIIEKNFEYE